MTSTSGLNVPGLQTTQQVAQLLCRPSFFPKPGRQLSIRVTWKLWSTKCIAGTVLLKWWCRMCACFRKNSSIRSLALRTLWFVMSSQSAERLHKLLQPGAKGFTGEENMTGTHRLLKSTGSFSKVPKALVGVQAYAPLTQLPGQNTKARHTVWVTRALCLYSIWGLIEVITRLEHRNIVCLATPSLIPQKQKP